MEDMSEAWDDPFEEEIHATESAAVELAAKVRMVFENSPHGKEVADWIIDSLCGCGRPLFSENALVMARDVGKRDVGLVLREILSNRQEEEAGNATGNNK